MRFLLLSKYLDNLLMSDCSVFDSDYILCVCVSLCSNISVDLSSPDRFTAAHEGFSPTSVSVVLFFFFFSNGLCF